MDKPDFIRALLMNIGSNLDPVDLIRRIPRSLQIPDLKECLTKVVHDVHLQVCFNIITTTTTTDNAGIVIGRVYYDIHERRIEPAGKFGANQT
jgi:hypothetical protein